MIQKGSPVIDSGKRVWKTYKELEFREGLFEEIGEAFIEAKGIKAEKLVQHVHTSFQCLKPSILLKRI